MAFEYLEVKHLDVFNSFTGGGLAFPKVFTEPGGGIISAYKGHFGQGCSAFPYSASICSAPSVGPIPTPLSWNFLGLGVETGTRNLIGADVKIGSDISLGAISANYNAVFQNVVGFGGEVTPKKSAVAPKETHISAKGDLLGIWSIMGTPFIQVISHINSHSDGRLKKDIEPISS